MDAEVIHTAPGIRIDEQGIWYYTDAPIINEGVLNYFKSNLRRSGRIYYIENRYSGRIEHARLERVQGFPIFVRAVSLDEEGSCFTAQLDCGVSQRIEAGSLRILGERIVALELPESGVPARLGPTAMASLNPFLENFGQNENEYCLNIPGAGRIPLVRSSNEDWFDTAP